MNLNDHIYLSIHLFPLRMTKDRDNLNTLDYFADHWNIQKKVVLEINSNNTNINNKWLSRVNQMFKSN